MSEQLPEVLAELEKKPAAPIYLLMGEEFLVRKGADELVKRLLPDASSGLNYFVLDGGSPREVAQELVTLPMFPGRKVVLLRDPEFLAPKKGKADGLARAREAWKAGRRKEGARRLLGLVARAGWGVAELDPSSEGAPGAGTWREELDVELAEADLQFLREVALYCREERISAPEGDVSPLCAELERGLPPGHALVIAASDVDAKSPLLKVAREKGHVVDRKVAKTLKELDISVLAPEVLKPHGKRLSAAAAEELKDRVGANMRLLQSELEKLALYASGATIEAADVALLVERARDEEFMELSDALKKRNLPAALQYVQDAVANGAHGLQLLGAVASIVRGLVEGRSRLARYVRGPMPGNYNRFKAEVFPDIEKDLKAAKAKVPHPYGAFMDMTAAASMGEAALLDGLVACAEADQELKSGGDSQLVLERLLLRVLQRNG
jgi:DNA polymerase-3 subunit delta